jgi:hypothetical protein
MLTDHERAALRFSEIMEDANDYERSKMRLTLEEAYRMIREGRADELPPLDQILVPDNGGEMMPLMQFNEATAKHVSNYLTGDGDAPEESGAE